MEIDGLAQTTDGSGAQRSRLQGFVGVAGYEDNRYVETEGGQMALKIKTAHFRHLDIQYQALRFSHEWGPQERLG